MDFDFLMDFDSCLHAYTNYLNLEYRIPLLTGSDSSLECYNKALHVIEKAMRKPTSGPMIRPTIVKLRHRAAFLYACHMGSLRPPLQDFPIQLGSQDDNSKSFPNSPAEKQALLNEVNCVTEKTQILRYGLPEDMPVCATWKYLHVWKWALPQSSLNDSDEDNWAEDSDSNMLEDEDEDWDGNTVR